MFHIDTYKQPNDREKIQQSPNDKLTVLSIVENDGIYLADASEKLKNDREVVKTAVKNSPLALLHASGQLKNDYNIVLTAVKNYGVALHHAGDELKKNRDIVKAAVQQNDKALKYAGDELKQDPTIAEAAVKQNRHAVKYIPEYETLAKGKLGHSHEIVRAAVRQDGLALEYADEELKKNREIVRAAVKQNNSALEYASDQLKNGIHALLNNLLPNNLRPPRLKTLERHCSRIEDILTYGSIVPGINFATSAMKLGFGLMQTLSASIAWCLKRRASENRQAEDNQREISHIKHGIANIGAAFFEAIPCFGALRVAYSEFYHAHNLNQKIIQTLTKNEPIQCSIDDNQHKKFIAYNSYGFCHAQNTSKNHDRVIKPVLATW